MHHITDRIAHTTAFVTPVVEQWLEREIAQSVKDITHKQNAGNFCGFTLLNTFSGIGPHGGSSILIRQGVLHSPVNLTTNLQAVAVRLTLHVAVTLCSLCIS